MKKLLIRLSVLLTIFFIYIQEVFAADIGSGSTQFGAFISGSGYETTKPNLTLTIAKVVSALLAFLGVVFTLLIIYSGYLWMTSAGDEGKVTKAKTMILNSSIGLAIIVASYAISVFIIGTLTKSV